jgi:hypothetical protein
LLTGDGLLDPTAPVAETIPEFAALGNRAGALVETASAT